MCCALCFVCLSWIALSLDCPILIATLVFSNMYLQTCESYIHAQFLKIHYNNKLPCTFVCQYLDKIIMKKIMEARMCFEF
jgi:hypothetical protein